MPEADVLRVFTVALLVFDVAFFPATAWRQGRHWSAWLAIVSAELVFVGYISAIVDHLGEPFLWYRTPVALLAALLMAVYIVYVFSKPRNEIRNC
jgi:hypothetical protein